MSSVKSLPIILEAFKQRNLAYHDGLTLATRSLASFLGNMAALGSEGGADANPVPLAARTLLRFDDSFYRSFGITRGIDELLVDFGFVEAPVNSGRLLLGSEPFLRFGYAGWATVRLDAPNCIHATYNFYSP
jgi:hypothetical protein